MLPCLGDFNRDRTVDQADLDVLLAQWGAATTTTTADFNDDGIVDGADLGTLLGNWGPCDPTYKLMGYSFGGTLAKAMIAPVTSTLTLGQAETSKGKNVIVWNALCTNQAQ
jgi:hypothetical protein